VRQPAANVAVAPKAFRPWAVVAVKSLRRSKSRLGITLNPRARYELAKGMFERVLMACAGCPDLAGTLVATDGNDVAALGARRGAAVLRDAAPSGSGLSGVIDAALANLIGRGATHALVLMADLPRIESRDVAEVLGVLRCTDVLVVPDLRRCGTSALGVALHLGFAARFGHPDSSQRHQREAERIHARSRVVHNPRIALDIDTLEDLSELRRIEGYAPWVDALSFAP
jgi:2-phospho-L-lactate guanylyltransferase